MNTTRIIRIVNQLRGAEAMLAPLTVMIDQVMNDVVRECEAEGISTPNDEIEATAAALVNLQQSLAAYHNRLETLAGQHGIPVPGDDEEDVIIPASGGGSKGGG